ncbi:sugar ABC transporter permease [uncultured Jatrophihabitans sp.]|uniref:sugar ABC transporter permease n=1 Tax=uncultured Jatrophihabitans sp. TaxID=1610747 RepID=UPI0035CC644C
MTSLDKQKTDATVAEPTAGEDDTSGSDELSALTSTAPVEGGVGAYVRLYVQRVRGGDMGSLPAITGLVVLAAIFSIVHPAFHSVFNFGNMFTEGTGTIFIAMGLVFVLLLGEIDLAAGYTAGVCAAVMVRLMVGYGQHWYATIPAALAVGLLIGFITGWLRAKIGIPSFIVTLAFFLAFQGVMLFILNTGAGQHGDISITDNVITDLENDQMPIWAGWTMAAILVGGYLVAKLAAVRSRRKQGLAAEPVGVWGSKVVALAVIVGLVVFLLGKNRALNTKPAIQSVNGKFVKVFPPKVEGVPWVVPVLLVLLVAFTILLGRTRYGRHLYAVGGNEEAARRAGIPVDRIRISVFMFSGFMAAIGGIVIGSNVNSVSENNYGGNTLLLAVGAAVIGGTSLFGGRGRMIDAVIGGAVVEVIYNGTANLINTSNTAVSNSLQFVCTGVALLLAAAVDALSRRRAGSSGLA